MTIPEWARGASAGQGEGLQTVWTDGRVTIRPCELGDVGAHYEAVRESIAQISPWLPWCHPGYARSESEAWIRERIDDWVAGRSFAFAVEDAQTGRFLGCCGVNHINHTHNFANIYYWVRASCAGRGVTTAATRLAARFGFQALGLTRLELVVGVGNAASRRVAEKAGAKLEGVQRNRLWYGDRPGDGVMYALTPEDLG